MTDHVIERVLDESRWRADFERLRSAHPHGADLRDLEDDLTGWRLYASTTRGTMVAVSLDAEIAHLVSDEHAGTEAMRVAVREGGLWGVVVRDGPVARTSGSLGFTDVASVPGIPGSSDPWMRPDVTVIARTPEREDGPVRCSGADDMRAVVDAVVAWAREQRVPQA